MINKDSGDVRTPTFGLELIDPSPVSQGEWPTQYSRVVTRGLIAIAILIYDLDTWEWDVHEFSGSPDYGRCSGPTPLLPGVSIALCDLDGIPSQATPTSFHIKIEDIGASYSDELAFTINT